VIAGATALSPLTWAVAHRGEPRDCVENTLTAIRRAVELRAHAIEVDVRCTSDGVAVLHHDEHLSRVWKHPGELARMTFAALRGLTPAIPTLGEALAAMDPAGPPLVIDVTSIKDAKVAYRAALDAEALKSPAKGKSSAPRPRRTYRRGDHPSARVWFCGQPRALAALRKQDPDLVLMLSWGRLIPPSKSLVTAVDPTYFNPWHRLLTAAGVRSWQRRGTLVSTWTVDSPQRRRQLLGWGVDAIISNDVANTVSDVHKR
jgi:glycerophosphoryl diester phosphodiesterase